MYANLDNFGKIWGSSIHPPLPIMAQLANGADPNVHSHAKFLLNRFILSSLTGKKPQILPHSQLQHLVVEPASVEIVEHEYTTMNLPYPHTHTHTTV